MIPWDDDVDLMIPMQSRDTFCTQLELMNETLVGYHRLEYEDSDREYCKVFFQHSPSAGDYYWSFPFVDVFFYVTNATHLWQMNDAYSAIQLKHVFPLVMRPFGDVWLPAAHDPGKIFQFDPFVECKEYDWNHRNESIQDETIVRCADLEETYPFVQRTNQSNSMEILRINHTVIHTVIYP